MSTVLQIRIDESIKERSDFVLKSVGLDLSTAIRMFLIKVIQEGGLPFSANEESLNEKNYAKTIALMQKKAEESGLNKLTLDEINTIINETREERKKR